MLCDHADLKCKSTRHNQALNPSYHRDLLIQVMSRFRVEQVTWENYQRMLSDPIVVKRIGMNIQGRSLEVEIGKHYPVREGLTRVATKLIEAEMFSRLWHNRHTAAQNPIL
jgi:hypothetical protein